MRHCSAIFLYLGFVFLPGALMAPWIYELTQWMTSYSPGLAWLADKPFHRFLSRSLLLMALLGLRPFLNAIGIRTWHEAGLKRSPQAWSQFVQGTLLGFASLTVIVALTILGNAVDPRLANDLGHIPGHLANALLAAATVSLLEELLFRGAIFGGLRKSLSWPAALVVSSLIYAALHFIDRAAPTSSIDWASGLIALGSMLSSFGHPEKLMPGLMNLAVAGAILGTAYQRTGTLFLPIGLHAGWIFWIKSYGFLFKQRGVEAHWFWGGHKLIDGWVATPVLLTMLVWMVRGGTSGSCSTTPDPGPGQTRA
ncbi:MAG: CPBP family intramembrane metalloprotease [Verrucomicrobia bacterium]|nr:CPBP family intramembrane metalloprotease [Verrucomicrobiota bacterium]